MKEGTEIPEAFKERLTYAHKYTLEKISQYKNLIENCENNGITIHELTVYKEMLEEFRRRAAWERDLVEEFEEHILPHVKSKKLPYRFDELSYHFKVMNGSKNLEE